MLDSRRIQHRGLKRLWRDGDPSGVNADWIPRVRRLLNQLDAATCPEDMDMPGNRFHEGKGTRRGEYQVNVTGNWRMFFHWDDDGPYRVTLEDRHGKS